MNQYKKQLRESDLQAKCIAYAKKELKGVVIARSSTEGFPDRMFIYQGYVVFVEFKAKGKKARPLQIDMHDRLSNNGFETFVIDDYDDFKIILPIINGFVIPNKHYKRLISPQQSDIMAGFEL